MFIKTFLIIVLFNTFNVYAFVTRELDCGFGHSPIEQSIALHHLFIEKTASINPLYQKNPMFMNLSSDPDHAGKITFTSQLEAVTGLVAENHGIVKGLRRGPPMTEFIDELGTYWDVKTPISPCPLLGDKWKFRADQVGASILKKINRQQFTIFIFLDLSYIRNDDLLMLRSWMATNIPTRLQNRIVEIIADVPLVENL